LSPDYETMCAVNDVCSKGGQVIAVIIGQKQGVAVIIILKPEL